MRNRCNNRELGTDAAHRSDPMYDTGILIERQLYLCIYRADTLCTLIRTEAYMHIYVYIYKLNVYIYMHTLFLQTKALFAFEIMT